MENFRKKFFSWSFILLFTFLTKGMSYDHESSCVWSPGFCLTSFEQLLSWFGPDFLFCCDGEPSLESRQKSLLWVLSPYDFTLPTTQYLIFSYFWTIPFWSMCRWELMSKICNHFYWHVVRDWIDIKKEWYTTDEEITWLFWCKEQRWINHAHNH